MNKTTDIRPTITQLLDEFFGLYKPNATKALRERIDLVRSHLCVHVETEGPRELTTPQRVILEADRAFDPNGAFARTMNAPELFYVLVRYLQPDYAMTGEVQRGIQIDVVAALAAYLWSRRLISSRTISECDLIEFDVAMERARAVRRPSRGR